LYIPSDTILTKDKLKESCDLEEATNPLCFFYSRIDIEKQKIEDVDKSIMNIVNTDKELKGFILLEISEYD